MNDDLFFAPIVDLNARLRKREFSTVDLIRAFTSRLETLGPRFNALALPLTESAIRRAMEVDKDLKIERFRGPLQGIPFGAKDLLAVAGTPTTWGAKPYAGQVFDETATVLNKLDQKGAVLTGKLSMVELAGGGGYRLASASLFGPGLNPWDRSRWSGGSSSGAASAVAAGLVPYAIGSETSGSILSPSAYCGVTGLRPTYGLVSRHGAMALSWTLDKLGPLCRTADDCGHVLQAIAGGDSNDPGSVGKSFYYAPQYARKMTELKVGFAPVDMDWMDAEARPALESAIETIKKLGCQFSEVSLPEFPYDPVISVIIGAEEASIFESLITSGKVDQLADPSQAAGLRANLELPARDYLKAMRIRRLIQEKFRELFSQVDLLIAPARYNVAPPVGEPLDGPEPARNLPKRGMKDLIEAGNLAGLPALCLPCGFAGKLPVALQLVGSPFSENRLLAAGREFQRVTDWHQKRPVLMA